MIKSNKPKQNIHISQPGVISSTLINHNLVRNAVGFNCSFEEGCGSSLATSFRQHEIKCFAKFINSPILIKPLSFDSHISFTDTPRLAGGGFALSRLYRDER